jgi:hypothetical protein
LQSKREGKSLKDTLADKANVNFGLLSPRGVSALVTPNDDDRLVRPAAVRQLRRERPSGPTHVVDGGGDASQVDTIEISENYRGFTDTWKIWKGRRPIYRFDGRVNVFCSGNVYSETIPTSVITY